MRVTDATFGVGRNAAMAMANYPALEKPAVTSNYPT